MPKRIIALSEEDVSQLQELAHGTGIAIEAKRAQAILMIEEKMSEGVIKKITGIDKRYAYKLRKLYLKKGLVGIREKIRKSRSLLTKKEQNELLNIIQTSTPRAAGYNADFWTTSIIADFIEIFFNVKYKSKTPIYVLLEKAKFTYHKPDRQYKNRNQDEIDGWIKINRDLFEKYHTEEDTVLLVEDELILTAQTTFQKIWLPKGSFPKITVSNERKKRCVFGFLDVKTGIQHAFKANFTNAEEFIKVLDEIGKKHPRKKIVIVLDNASWHKSKKIQEYLALTEHDIHFIYFMRYAPETNPQENVWKAARANVTHNKFIDNIDKATDEFVSYLNNSNFNYNFFHPHKFLEGLVEF